MVAQEVLITESFRQKKTLGIMGFSQESEFQPRFFSFFQYEFQLTARIGLIRHSRTFLF